MKVKIKKTDLIDADTQFVFLQHKPKINSYNLKRL